MSDSSGAQSSIASTTGNSSQAPESPAGQPNSPTKHRVKIEGTEREVSTEDLIRDYQLREASNKRFQEASQKEKRAQPVLDALEKKEFKKLLEHVPKGDFRKFAEDFLLEEIEYDELPEYEKRRMAAERERDDAKAELKRRDDEANKQGHQKLMQDAALDVDTEITAVLQQLGTNPTPYIVARILDEMIARHEADGERLPAAKAAERAQVRLQQEMESYLNDLPDDEIVKRISPQKLDSIRKHLLAQVGMQQPKRNQAPASQRTRDTSKPTSIDGAFAEMEARFKKGAKK